jgi:hypothetical protein
MNKTYYCIELPILFSFAISANGTMVAYIDKSNLGNYGENDCLLVTESCKEDLSAWKGMIIIA